MRNNLQNDVKVEKGREYSTKLDLSGSVSETLSLGKINVKFMRHLLPYTKALVGDESLIYLSPMVRPTYGKLFYKQWHYFLAIEDIWKGYPSFMTGQPISVNGNLVTFTHEPAMTNGLLAAFAFIGAKASLYISKVTEASPLTDGVNRDYYIRSPLNVNYNSLVARIMSDYYYVSPSDHMPYLRIMKLLGIQNYPDEALSNFPVVSGNLTIDTFKDLTNYGSVPEASAASGFDLATVPIDKCDYKIFFGFTDTQNNNEQYVCCLAFNFSSFGQWYSNILRALGYGFNPMDRKVKSILPLLGCFMAYWNSFGVEQFQNFESTYCGRLISWINVNANYGSKLDFDSRIWSLFTDFLYYELGSMWVTEQADYIAAHLPQPVISAQPELFTGISDVSSSGTGSITIPISHSDNEQEPSAYRADGHAYMNKVQHGALDSKLLMRLYKVTNRNTPLGRKISDLMDAAGLGFYKMYCKPNFVGQFSTQLQIGKVTAQSDTFNPVTGDGAPLGDYAGRGIGYKNNDGKLFTKSAVEGYYYCLDAITCDAGYSQGVDQTLQHITRGNKFQPDYDGFGLVVHDLDLLIGNTEMSTDALKSYLASAGVTSDNVVDNPAEKSFGFAPTNSEYKVGRSIVNGGFALPSERNTYLPFILDKQIFANVLSLIKAEHGDDIHHYKVGISLPSQEIPLAGSAWRFLSRFFWLSNLNRIFSYQGQSLPTVWDVFQTYKEDFEFVYRQKDNYTVISEVWFKAWSACLPIEETWGTLDPDKKELEYYERN